jgi:hypothetical protein
VLSTTVSFEAQSTSPASGKGWFDNLLVLVKGLDEQPPVLPFDLDVNVAVWAPTALQPVPFLRLTHVPGGDDMKADFYVWWMPPANVHPQVLPRNPHCSPSSQGSTVCIAKVEILDKIDWSAILVDIAATRVCAFALTGTVTIGFDAGDLEVRMYSKDQREEYSCNAPRGSARAGAREAARVMDVLEKLAIEARSRW